DRRLCERVRELAPEELARWRPDFADPRLPELLFRYRARNWPDTLDRDERSRWEASRRRRLTDPAAGASITLDVYRRELSRLAVATGLQPAQRAVIDALLDWPAELGL
ncbi:MAG: exodeoxyribonuclease, partial [Pseudomonadota bacterium]